MIYNEEYDKRYKKVRDCIEGKNEKVVSTFMGQSVAPAFYDDMTLAEYMDDMPRGFQRYLEFVDRLNKEAPVDCINFGYPGAHYAALTLCWWSRIKRPGHELPPDAVWQCEEKKTMLDTDYETIANGGFEEVQKRVLSQVIDDLGAIDEFFKFYGDDFDTYMRRYVDAGYPVLNTGLVCPPFETLCGGRGMNKFFMDCYKKMDIIKAAEDAMMPALHAQIDAMPKEDYMIARWIGGWRGASNMVSPKIWNTLVWPYIKELALHMIENGFTPIIHMDACWDRDLERFGELPAHKVILNTDGMTNLRKAREVLGDHCAFMGDVPAQMLTVSSKEEIKEYARRLIDDIGPKGFFLTAGCDAPSCSKYENLVAIHEVAAEF